jgi:chromosome segregation ATPase
MKKSNNIPATAATAATATATTTINPHIKKETDIIDTVDTRCWVRRHPFIFVFGAAVTIALLYSFQQKEKSLRQREVSLEKRETLLKKNEEALEQKKKETSLERMEKELNLNKVELERVEYNLKQMNAIIEKYEKDIKYLSSMNKTYETIMANQTKQLGTVEIDKEKLNNDHADEIRQLQTNHTNEICQLHAEIDNFSKNRQALLDEITYHQQQSEKFKKIIDNLNAEIVQKSDWIKIGVAQVESLNKQIEKLTLGLNP